MIPIADGDPPVKPVSLAASLVLAVPRAYALLFFSANERFGWWLLAITLLAPDLGLAGLAGACAAAAIAWWLGYDRANIRNGYLIFNPLLICLTLAYLNRCYHFHPEVYFLLWSASVLGSLFLSAAMQQWVGAHFGLSAQSLPAVFAGYVLYFLGFALFGAPGLPAVTSNRLLDAVILPPFWQVIFQAFGAMLFQPRVVPGVLVFAGLAVASPLSALVGVAAVAAGAVTMHQLGFALGPEAITWCGFNFLLCGIALGSGYFITSSASLALAVSGASLCALVSLALATALRYFGLPASALPYNLVVLTLVYSLRQRQTAGALHPSPSPGALPESAARQVLLDARRFPHLETPALFLPFEGQRVITQAFDSRLTHRGQWRYGLDFEAERDGKRHQGAGASATDFPIYETPVLSPCHGVAASVVDGIPDNEPGHNNPEANWGNHAILYNDAGYYVLLAHLKPGSFAVAAGQRVSPGALIALCGNSGRSPTPHLHLQIQNLGLLGAPTRPFCLKHYVEVSADGIRRIYETAAIPTVGARVQPATPNAELSESLHGWLPGEYRYRVQGDGGGVREETLLLDFDEQGRYRLRSRRCAARLTAFLSEGVFYTTDFEGDSRSLLAFMAAGLARVPCIADEGVAWRDQVSAIPFLAAGKRWLSDLVEPFFGTFLLHFTYRLEQEATDFVVRAVSDSEAQRGKPSPHAPRRIECRLAQRRGLTRLEARLHNDRVLTAELADYQPLC